MTYFVEVTTEGRTETHRIERGPLPYPIAARKFARCKLSAGSTAAVIVITEDGQTDQRIEVKLERGET